MIKIAPGNTEAIATVTREDRPKLRSSGAGKNQGALSAVGEAEETKPESSIEGCKRSLRLGSQGRTSWQLTVLRHTSCRL